MAELVQSAGALTPERLLEVISIEGPQLALELLPVALVSRLIERALNVGLQTRRPLADGDDALIIADAVVPCEEPQPLVVRCENHFDAFRHC